MAVAADVPFRYDIVLDGEGYCFYRPFTGGDSTNAPQLGVHSFSPAFVPRTNTSGSYGDDQQDFYLTFSQKDWSLGEQQKYQQREAATRRYWIGTNVDARTVGQVSLRRAVNTVNLSSEDALAAVGRFDTVRVASDTNLFTIDGQGSATDHGAHGLGGTPATPHGIAVDSTNTYISSASAAKVRKWDGSAFSDFSASGADSLAYLNNALYGFTDGLLVRWTTAGARSTLFTFQDADGDAAAYGDTDAQIVPFGGKLLVHLTTFGGLVGQTWIYDGVGTSKLFDHPPNFLSRSICVLNGTIFFGGAFSRQVGASTQYRPAVMYYANGNLGTLWQSNDYFTFASDLSGSHVTALDNGVLFTDDLTEKFMWYDIANGGVTSVGSYATPGTGPQVKLVSCRNFAFLSSADNLAYIFPDDTDIATSGTVTSSLLDFDNSLKKVFSGIKVDYDEASDGDGGSVDIAYRIGDVGGAFTTLQTGATSGTEYTLTNTTGNSISVRLTLNKGTSTAGPVVKRVYVRAAPFGISRHRGLFHIDCTDDARDGTEQDFVTTGHERAMALREAAMSESVLSLTDAFETMDVVVESCELTQIRPGKREYMATVLVREA